MFLITSCNSFLLHLIKLKLGTLIAMSKIYGFCLEILLMCSSKYVLPLQREDTFLLKLMYRDTA